MIEVCGLLS